LVDLFEYIFLCWINTANCNKGPSVLPKLERTETEYITAMGD